MNDTDRETGRGDVWVCIACGLGWEARSLGEAAAIHDIETDDHAFVDADSRIVGEDPGYGDLGTARIAAAEAAEAANADDRDDDAIQPDPLEMLRRCRACSR